jgi:GT2 family glycosyltransferase
MTAQYPRVAAVTIMYGDRWKYLSKVVEAAMRDPFITHMVIVDNGAAHKGQIREGVRIYGDKVTVLETGRNLGSAGGFAVGLEHARGLDVDFIFVLDDDSVPEEGSVQAFMDILKLFPDKKVVLSGSRYDVLDNKEYFYMPSIPDDRPRGTFFEVFSWRKVLHFLKLLFRVKKKHRRGPFIPIIPTEGFIYGGAFLPIEAVRTAPLPDRTLFLYGDDVEYSWNIKKLGYVSYLCTVPRIHDIDLTFGESDSHIFGQFDPQTAPFKVYYRLRNMVRLSRKHTRQGRVSLFLNIIIWVLGLFLLGLIKRGPTADYFGKISLMAKAVYAGYFPNSHLAKTIENSFFPS